MLRAGVRFRRSAGANGEPKPQPNRRTTLLIFVWSLIAAIAFVLMNAGLRAPSTRLDPNLVNFWKNLLWLPVYLLVYLIFSGSPADRRARSAATPVTLISGSLANGAGIILLCVGLQLLPISTVTFVNASKNIFVLALSGLLTREKASPRLWAACGIGLVGVWMTVQPDDIGGSWTGSLVVLASSACAALAIVQIGQSFRGYSLALVLLYMTVGEIVAALPVLLPKPIMISPIQMPYAFCVGGAGVIAAFASAQLIRLVRFPMFALLQFLRLPTAVVLGYLLFGEQLDPWSWGGGALIFVAIWFGYRRPDQAFFLPRRSSAAGEV
jgi:drug/metabolite transporter (DMT)-like permease